MALIILFLLIGLILLYYEIYFIPGTSLIGVVGGLLSIFSILLIFRKYGSLAGYISLFFLFLIVFVFVFTGGRNKVWQRISNRNIIDTRSNTIEQDEIKPGQRGFAVTDIKPQGTAKINDVNYFVQAEGGNIKKGEQVEVTRVVVSDIIVKAVENNA